MKVSIEEGFVGLVIDKHNHVESVNIQSSILMNDIYFTKDGIR